MKTRADYERAIQTVREVIHRWDPYDLLGGCGCPPDEFDREIARIVVQIPRIQSPTDATLVLSRIFSSAFDPERFRPEDCAAVGAELYQILSTRGFCRTSMAE
jgi:Domain of unknown function (DUF1871)